MFHMRTQLNSVICGAFFLAASGSAFAADMAVKAPPPAPASVYNWTGWYAGVNAGASFGNVKTDVNVAPVTETDLASLTSVTGPGFAFSDREYPDGFIGGGQIGYNWQFSPLIVLGVEADFQGALERDSANLSNSFSASAPRIDVTTGLPTGITSAVFGTETTSYTTQIDWFGTVRARVGYVWGNGEVMCYVTGGLAYGEVKINGTNTVSQAEQGFPPGVFAASVTQAFDQSHVNTDWVVGYGTEGKLLIPGWTLKAEYLYMDLGTLDSTGVTSGVAIFPGFTGTGGKSPRTAISPTKSSASG
jgi:outer membrane immunogenic protein